MNLLFINHCEGFRVPRVFLEQWVEKTFKCLQTHHLVKKTVLRNIEHKELIIVFASQQQGRKLNHQFRGKNESTDVLSFAPIEKGCLGEIVLCVPVVKTQAIAHKQTLRKEIAHLVLHGILHLLGYDHGKSDKEARLMFKIQDDIFAKI